MSENKPLTRKTGTAETKFAVVLKPPVLSEDRPRRSIAAPQRSLPRTNHGLATSFITGQKSTKAQQKEVASNLARTQKRIQELERELRRKDKALADRASRVVGAAKKAQRLLGDERQRGQLTSLPERQLIVAWLGSAVAAGARKIRACQEIGLSLRTLQRWTETEVIQADARTIVTRPTPRNALSEVERQTIVTLCNSPEYAHLPPSQIVPRLADQGRYVASEGDVLSRSTCGRPTTTSRPQPAAQKARSTDNACGQSARSGVVVGHHVICPRRYAESITTSI